MNKHLSKYLFYYPVTLARGELVFKYLKKYEASQWWDRNDIADYQLNHAKKLLIHAIENCPYYKESMADKGISIADVYDLNSINQLPDISKTDIDKYRSTIISEKNKIWRSRYSAYI